MKLWEQLRERMMRYPEKTIKEGNATMTYEQVVIFAETCAERFPKLPYMGIFCESEMATAIGILAGFAAGIPVIPLPRRYGKDACLKIIERADIPALFTDQNSSFRLVRLPGKGRKTVPENVAAILFTSGSTGEPKGAMLTDRNLLANVKSISGYYPVNDEDRVLIARTLYHSSALTCDLLTSLWNGADIVFSSGQFQPLRILKLFRDEQITAFGSTPS
ncbi:MAG: AMP-binding protein, partial [Clostridia bacterium]|nr:AMP-binding protein [Clostridia bacterium]